MAQDIYKAANSVPHPLAVEASFPNKVFPDEDCEHLLKDGFVRNESKWGIVKIMVPFWVP